MADPTPPPPPHQSRRPPGTGPAAGAARARAAALIDLGRHDEALRVTGEGLAAAPGDAHLLRLRAVALENLGRLYDATDAAADAISAQPDDPGGFMVRASIRTAQARAETVLADRRAIARMAVEDASEAVRLAPNAANAHRQLAESLAYAGESEAAWSAARRAAELDPDHASSWVTLSMVAIVCEGDPVAVEAMARRALSIDPLSYAALNNLGVALMQQGRRKEAAPLLRRAAASNPRGDTAVGNLARVGTSVIVLAVVAAVSALFFSPLGVATVFILMLALNVLLRPRVRAAMRGPAIKVALLLPRLHLPSTTALMGLAAIGVSAYTLAEGGSRILGISLAVGGAITVAYQPVGIRIRRARIARHGLDRFPKRSALNVPSSRAITPRTAVIAVWLVVVLVRVFMAHPHHSSGTGPDPSLSAPFPSAGETPQTTVGSTVPVVLSDPATILQSGLEPGGFWSVPDRVVRPDPALIAADYGAGAGIGEAYRRTFLSAGPDGGPDPYGPALSETALSFGSAADAAAFAQRSADRAEPPSADRICSDAFEVAPAGVMNAVLYLVDGDDVLVVRLDNDVAARTDIRADTSGVAQALPGFINGGCRY